MDENRTDRNRVDREKPKKRRVEADGERPKKRGTEADRADVDRPRKKKPDAEDIDRPRRKKPDAEDADRPKKKRVDVESAGREEDWEETKKRQKREDLGKSIIREILSTSIYLLFVLAATYLIICYVGQRTGVDGSSMEPTLQDGDNLIVDKISYRFREPERYDIIVFPFQYEPNTYYIKRIIGMPGESVRIDWEGNIYIDGELLTEGYGREVIRDPGRAEMEIALGDDEYFVLGDNRNNSTDSRAEMVGNIHRKDIVGKAWVRIYPFGKFGKLRHK